MPSHEPAMVLQYSRYPSIWYHKSWCSVHEQLKGWSKILSTQLIEENQDIMVDLTIGMTSLFKHIYNRPSV